MAVRTTVSQVARLQNDWLGKIARRMRAPRLARFAALAEALGKPVRILDVGRRNEFWDGCGWAGRADVHIILANVEPQEKLHSKIDFVYADATHLDQFEDQSFDIVFSNSVIEHLGTFERQTAMARTVRRIG